MMFVLTHSKSKVLAQVGSLIWNAACRACLLPTLLLLTSVAMGANHYILPSPGTGAKDGSDWANACSDFSGNCAPSRLLRGDTYYVGGGSYGATTFNTPESGTAIIVVKGAIAADHGTSTGWSNPLGVDVRPATFTYPFNVYNGYVVFDGNTGTPSAGTSSYGFAVALPTSCANGNSAIQIGPGGTTVNNVQISHFYLLACPGDVQTEAIALQTVTTANNYIYSYNYINGFQVAFFDHSTGVTIDHNYLINAFSSASHHGNQFDFIDAEVNPTVSNNTVLNCAGTNCLGANDNGSTCSQGLTGAKIYGNVFNATLTTGGTQPVGDGIIAATSRCFIANTSIYNNTFTGTATPGQTWVQACVTNQSTCSRATGNVAENNIIWNAICALGSNIQTDDYNSFLSCVDTAPTETHGQAVNLNPFVDSGTNNYQLAVDGVANCTSTTAVCTGVTFGAPYNVDPDDVTRAGDGTWERGIYENPNSNEVQPPTGLAAVVN